MLTHRDRGWSALKESRRRDRCVHDLLQRSGGTRLHQRVTIAEADRSAWRRSERLIVEMEKAAKALKLHDPDFWERYRRYEEALVDLYRDAGIEFAAG